MNYTKIVKKPSRHQTRFVCVQAIIQGMLTDFKNSIEDYLTYSRISIDEEFCKKLYEIVFKNGDYFSQLLTEKVKNRKFDAIDISLKAILFAATAELFYLNTDKPVVISEYVTLTKRLTADSNYKFVHAVIDSLKK